MAEDIKKEESKEVVVTPKAKPYSKPRKLTPKQINFIKEKIKDPTISNAQAAINAGYEAGNRNLASRTGHAVMNNPLVQSELKKYIVDGALDIKAQEAYTKILNRELGTIDKESDKANWAALQTKVIQEIHKIQGNYSPKKSETKRANFNFNIPDKK